MSDSGMTAAIPICQVRVPTFLFNVQQLILGFYSSNLKTVLQDVSHVTNTFSECHCSASHYILNVFFSDRLQYKDYYYTLYPLTWCTSKKLHRFRSGEWGHNPLLIIQSHRSLYEQCTELFVVWDLSLSYRKRGIRSLVSGHMFKTFG